MILKKNIRNLLLKDFPEYKNNKSLESINYQDFSLRAGDENRTRDPQLGKLNVHLNDD